MSVLNIGLTSNDPHARGVMNQKRFMAFESSVGDGGGGRKREVKEM